MKSLLYYLLQVIVASGILYGYYHLALRNKKFHRYNRFYLLAATVISITIPFLNIPVYFSPSETDSSFVLQTLTVISSGGGEIPTVITAPEIQATWFSWQNLSFLFYLLIAFLVLIRIIFSLVKIRRIIKTNPVEQLDRIQFVNTSEPGTPFSFFRWLFWNKKIELQSEKGEQIFRHELFHIKQKHSWDIMYLELLTILFWINPFFHLIKKEVKAIHEFLADQFAVTENKKWEYAELLLMQVLNTKQQLVNPFFHNQIKRRIAMITTSKKPSYQYLRKMMVLPVAAIVMGLFAFSYKEKIKIEDNNRLFISELTNLKDTIKNPSPHKIIWMEDFPLPSKKSPTSEQLKVWTNPKIYGVWLDDKRISNSELAKYKFSDFALYNVSKLAKNTVNYGKHFYQVNLLTNEYYDNSQDYKKPNTKKYYILKDTTKPLLGNRFEKSLIVIDGKIQDGLTAADVDKQLNSNDIESINVLKGPSAISKYSDKGKNGVIEIITKKRTANENKEVTLQEIKEVEADNKIFSQVETEPSFPDGASKWQMFLMKYLDASVPFKKKAPNGTYITVIQFIVDKEGNITNVKPLTNHGFGMEEEAIRVIKAGPKWVPALQNGKKVNAYRKQAVTFILGKGEANFASATKTTGNELNEVVVKYLSVQNTNENIFQQVEIRPTFPGGDTAWRKYLEKNANGRVPIDSGAPAGIYTVLVQFIVDKDGSISDVKATTKHGFGMENEVMRIIKNGPKWIPATQNGKIVKAYTKQPITFQVEQEADKLPAKPKLQKAGNGSPQLPEISLDKLKKATPLQLLQLPEGTEIVGYKFTIDLPNDDIVAVANTGKEFNSATKNLMLTTTVGRLITFDLITIMENGKEKKIPSKVYAVTN